MRDENDKIVGTLLYYLSGPPLCRQLHSPYDGLLADNDDYAQTLFEEIQMLAIKMKVVALRICSGSRRYNFHKNTEIKFKLGINLNISKDQLWKSLRDKTRNAIRKGEKSGIHLKQGNCFLADFYKVYAARMQAKNVEFHSYRFFYNLVNHYGDDCYVYIAEYQGLPIASALILHVDRVAHYLFSGMTVGYEELCPIQSILWHAIENGYTKKISYFDMGESSVGSGTYKFKIWFGCQAKEVYYYSAINLPTHHAQLVLNKIISKLYQFSLAILFKIPMPQLKNILLVKRKLNGKII